MKKLLNLFFLSILALSYTSLIGQETEQVFMIDPKIDISKTFQVISGIRVFPSSKSQIGFAVPEYSIKNNAVSVAKVNKSKRIPLEINPRKVPLFFSINNSNGEKNLLIYDFNKPGEFMNKEGDIVIPDNVKPSLIEFIQKELIVPKAPNKSVTDQNTVFNSKLENPANKNNSDHIFLRVPIQNSNFNILCDIVSGKNGIQTNNLFGFSLGIKGQFQGSEVNIGETVSTDDFSSVLFAVGVRTTNALGRGEAITMAQCIAKNLIGLMNQCKTDSKPAFCSIIDQDDLNEQLRQAILNACNLQNPIDPSFNIKIFSKDNPFYK